MTDCPPFSVDKIKAGWATYQLTEADPVGFARDGLFAQADHTDLTIKVVRYYGHAQAANSLLHELLHVAAKRWRIGKVDDEERWVSTLAEALCSIWRDNPTLFEWIHKGLTDG